MVRGADPGAPTPDECGRSLQVDNREMRLVPCGILHDAATEILATGPGYTPAGKSTPVAEWQR